MDDVCFTCGLKIGTIKGMDRCGLKRELQPYESCVFRDRGWEYDLELTPAEIANLDQYGAEMLAQPPIPINLVVLTKLLNRYAMVRRMRKLGMPPQHLQRQWAMVDEALEELRQWVIKNDAMGDWEPHRLREDGDE